jgi:hypothetical protein
VQDVAAGGAGADGQLLPGGGGEEPAGVVVAGLRQEPPGIAAGAHGRGRIRPLVVTGNPEVTRLTSAPGTWLVEVPRIWRTPSPQGGGDSAGQVHPGGGGDEGEESELDHPDALHEPDPAVSVMPSV